MVASAECRLAGNISLLDAQESDAAHEATNRATEELEAAYAAANIGSGSALTKAKSSKKKKKNNY